MQLKAWMILEFGGRVLSYPPRARRLELAPVVSRLNCATGDQLGPAARFLSPGKR